MRSRWKFIAIGLIPLLLLGGFLLWKQNSAPPQKSSIKTFLPDLMRAKESTKGNLQRYAYLFNRYTKTAFADKPWDEAIQALRGMDVQFKMDSHSWVAIEIPQADFVMPNGKRLKACLNLNRGSRKRTEGRTDFICSQQEAHFQITSQTSDIVLPSDTFLPKIFARKQFKAIEAKYPDSLVLTFAFQDFSTAIGYEHQLHANVTLRKNTPKGSEKAVIYYSAPSDLEPKPRQIVSWLPIKFTYGSDHFGAISPNGEKGENAYIEKTLELQRQDFEVPKTEFDYPITVMGEADSLALPTTTESIENETGVASPKSFLRLTSLKHLATTRYILSDSDAERLAQIQSLESLQVNISSPKQLEILTRLPKLRRLTVLYRGRTYDDLASIGTAKNLDTIAIRCDGDITPKYMAALASLPKLKSLYMTGQGSVQTSQLQPIQKLKSLEILAIQFRHIEGPISFIDPTQKIKSFALTRAKISRADLAAIAYLPHLRELIFMDVSGLEDPDLQLLAKRQKLDHVAFYNCEGITADGLQKLKVKLPPGMDGPYIP